MGPAYLKMRALVWVYAGVLCLIRLKFFFLGLRIVWSWSVWVLGFWELSLVMAAMAFSDGSGSTLARNGLSYLHT